MLLPKTKLHTSPSIQFLLLSEGYFLGQGRCYGTCLHMAVVPAERSPAMNEFSSVMDIIAYIPQHCFSLPSWPPYNPNVFPTFILQTTVEIRIAKESFHVSPARLGTPAGQKHRYSIPIFFILLNLTSSFMSCEVEHHSTCHYLVTPRRVPSSMIWNREQAYVLNAICFEVYHQMGTQQLILNELHTISHHMVLGSNVFLVPPGFLPSPVLIHLWEHKSAFLGLLRDAKQLSCLYS